MPNNGIGSEIYSLINNEEIRPTANLIISKTTKLNPVIIIIGLLVFGHFFGIIGMVLATPAVALIKIVYQFFAEKYGWFGTDY